MRRLAFPVSAALLLVPAAAQAHTYGAEGAGFMAGFGHPLGGLDHLLAMVAVGLWGSQLGGRALWLVPAAFVSVMTAGAALAMLGIHVPAVEPGIAASVVVLGVALAFLPRLPVAVPMAIVALFGLVHGHAHGTEMPEAASPALYGLGFALATILLHAAGIGLGLLAGRKMGASTIRTAGVVIAAAGAYLFAGI